MKLLRTNAPTKTNAQAEPPANKPAAAKPRTGAPTADKPTAQASGRPPGKPPGKPVTARSLTEGQRSYEAKRAAKAGMSLEKWLASKEREREVEAKAKLKAAPVLRPVKPPGLLGRLLERAQRPFGS